MTRGGTDGRNEVSRPYLSRRSFLSLFDLAVTVEGRLREPSGYEIGYYFPSLIRTFKFIARVWRSVHPAVFSHRTDTPLSFAASQHCMGLRENRLGRPDAVLGVYFGITGGVPFLGQTVTHSSSHSFQLVLGPPSSLSAFIGGLVSFAQDSPRFPHLCFMFWSSCISGYHSQFMPTEWDIGGMCRHALRYYWSGARVWNALVGWLSFSSSLNNNSTPFAAPI
jgi:hypothetical protein